LTQEAVTQDTTCVWFISYMEGVGIYGRIVLTTISKDVNCEVMD